MMINRMSKDNPCARECPERFVDVGRGITCHAVCPKYAAYRAKMDEECRERKEKVEREDVRTAAGERMKRDTYRDDLAFGRRRPRRRR